MPKFSKIICITGATELVVQEALPVMGFLVENLSSFTPMSAVTTSSPVGAVITTLFAPAAMCARAFSALVNKPVDSTTISTPNELQGSFTGSFSAKNFTLLGSFSYRPYTESYLRRYYSVYGRYEKDPKGVKFLA